VQFQVHISSDVLLAFVFSRTLRPTYIVQRCLIVVQGPDSGFWVEVHANLRRCTYGGRFEQQPKAAMYTIPKPGSPKPRARKPRMPLGDGMRLYNVTLWSSPY
jgi:hypothetical protein